MSNNKESWVKMFKTKDGYLKAVFFLTLVIVNYQLFFSSSNQQYYLNMQSVKEGMIWQIFTHPLAHLSIYHLATDLIVFILLFTELNELKNISKYKIILTCWVFSSFAAIISLPHYSVSTFGGLSGINYGMLTYICISNIYQKENSTYIKFSSIATLFILIIKQILESSFQNSFFQDFHLGYVGTPIIESHAGGILAAIIYYQIDHHFKNLNFHQKQIAI